VISDPRDSGSSPERFDEALRREPAPARARQEERGLAERRGKGDISALAEVRGGHRGDGGVSGHVVGDRGDELIEVGRAGTLAEVEQQALVLAAVGIASRLAPDGGVVRLYVAPPESARARRELACYARENAPARRPRLEARAALRRVEGALAYAAVLMFFFAAVRRHAFGVDWLAAGATHAGLILEGAWWRTVTALGLHAELGHLMSNLGFGMLIGVLVAQLLGSGLGWLAILLAGVLGNALNALFHDPGHTAIGASTALFGGLGILSGYARRSRTVPWRGGLRRWAPIGAGIMLLAFLGFGGERTDIGGHVWGFVAGGALGLALAHLGDRLPQGAQAQRIYGALACALFALAWLLALRAYA
jgi:rhomboid protease GluP